MQWEVEGAAKAKRISSWQCCHFLFAITALLGLQPASGCWLFTAVYTGCLIPRELYRCTRGRSLSRDHFAGGEVMRSGPFAKPRQPLSPPNPDRATPPVDSPACMGDGEANAARCDVNRSLLGATVPEGCPVLALEHP